MRHTLVVSAFLASTLAAAGCTGANSFQSLNDTFKTVKTTSAGLESAGIAGAAIATNLAAVELISAFSKNANGVISAGGGNVIAAGGSNYSVFAVNESGEADLNSDRKDKNGKSVVTAHYSFSRSQGDDGSLHYELKSFDGKASGFAITASGTFDFKPDGTPAVGGDIPATVAASLKGKIALNEKETVSLDELAFSVKNPLPENVDSLGHVKITDTAHDSGIDLTAFVKNKVIGIKGTITLKGKPYQHIEADENSQTPSLTPVDGASTTTASTSTK
jgi:hypothetical protein